MRQPCRQQRYNSLGIMHWVGQALARGLRAHGHLWLRRHGRVAPNLDGPFGDAPLGGLDAPVAGLAQLPLDAAPAGLKPLAGRPARRRSHLTQPSE